VRRSRRPESKELIAFSSAAKSLISLHRILLKKKLMLSISHLMTRKALVKKKIQFQRKKGRESVLRSY
jgi:hypothetical protein